jgi:putative PIN family toxin of toxin-antitoxin system
MLTAFIDANVFFSAVKSKSGGSYFIIELAKKKKIKIITVVHALSEAERNIQKKLGVKFLNDHYENLLFANPVVQSLVDLPLSVEDKLRNFVPKKDIPILAGAIMSGARFLITLDKIHFLDNKKLLDLNLSILITTPGGFIQNYILK